MLSRPRPRPHDLLVLKEQPITPSSHHRLRAETSGSLPRPSSSTEWSSSLDTALGDTQVIFASRAIRSGVTHLPATEAKRFSAARRYGSPPQSATDTDFTEILNRSSAGEMSLEPFTPFTPFTPPPPVPDKDGSTSIMQALQNAFLASGSASHEKKEKVEYLAQDPMPSSPRRSPLPLETPGGRQQTVSESPGNTLVPLIEAPQTPSQSSGLSYRISHDTNSLFGLERLASRNSAAHGRASSTYPASFSGELDDLADLVSIVGRLDGLSKRQSQRTTQADRGRLSVASSEGMITVFLDRKGTKDSKTESLHVGESSTGRVKPADKMLIYSPSSATDPEGADLEKERMAFLQFQAAEKTRIDGLEQWERQEREKQRLLRDEMKRDSVLRKLEVEQQVGWRRSASSLTPSHKSQPASRKSRSASRIANERSPPSEPLPPAPPSSAARSHFLSAASRGSLSPSPDSPAPVQLSVPGSLPTSPGTASRQRSASDGHQQRKADPLDVELTSSAPDPVPPRVPEKTGLGVMSRDILRQRSDSHLCSTAPESSGTGITTSLARKLAMRHPSYRVVPPSDSRRLDHPTMEGTARQGLGPGEGEGTVGSDQKHGGLGRRSLRGMPCLPPIATVSSISGRRSAHTRQGSASSSASRHSSILDYRREKRALEEQGLEGAPWIARVFDKTLGLRDSSDDDNGKAVNKHQVPPTANAISHLPHGVVTSVENAPQPTTKTPANATHRAEVASLAKLAQKEREAEEARRRAVWAEKAALEQVRIARELQQRLERELAEVSKRGRERGEAELAARARWAKEQAARQMLDAFERSKLEGEERKRRRKVEALKLEEAARVAEVAQERMRALQAEKDAIQEARRRLRDLAYREKKLIEERDARKKEEQAQADRKQKLEEHRVALKHRFKGFVDRAEKEGRSRETSPVLTGWAHVQIGEAMRWKRRYFSLQVGSLDLFKDEAGAEASPGSTPAPGPAESLNVSRISLHEETEEDAYELCQMPFSCLLRLAPGVVQKLEGNREVVMVTMSFDKAIAREEFLAALSFAIEEATVDESEAAYFARRSSTSGKSPRGDDTSSSSSGSSNRSRG